MNYNLNFEDSMTAGVANGNGIKSRTIPSSHGDDVTSAAAVLQASGHLATISSRVHSSRQIQVYDVIEGVHRFLRSFLPSFSA